MIQFSNIQILPGALRLQKERRFLWVFMTSNISDPAPIFSALFHACLLLEYVQYLPILGSGG
jgi:hypothetical protein